MHNQSDYKPRILISVESLPFPSHWQQVLWGIEEESIPYKIQQDSVKPIKDRAYAAAQQSALSVGIACTSTELVVHYKNLESDKPLFHMQYNPSLSLNELRNLGNNAARLVKGLPFKLTK